MIYWSEFSWEAFATLATGMAAVVGAYRLGRRQMKILDRQTALQESQLRISIFERRMDAFRSVERLIYGVIASGDSVSDEVERGFLLAKQEARFLFASDISDLCKEIWSQYIQLKTYTEVMNDCFKTEGHYGQENIDKKYAALKWLSECSDGLADRFKAINPILVESVAAH